MKKKLVILGTGFGAISCIFQIRSLYYDISLVSPRNFFLFTPLLPSTTVGTIEFRSIVEPIRRIPKPLTYYQASATSIDLETREVLCRSSHHDGEFRLPFDDLVIAVGATNNTFNIPGVRENCFFLKELEDARLLRQRVIDSFEHASLPGKTPEEISKLLHTVVVGGGPTGVEFAAELADLIEADLADTYPGLASQSKITVVEAGKQLLSVFDSKLSAYASQVFSRRKISVLTNSMVQKVSPSQVHLANGSVLDAGLIVWSTGNTANEFIKQLPFEKDRAGRLLTNDLLELPNDSHVYALGDCATTASHNQPATAQVAMQAGKYLGELLNHKAENHRRSFPGFKRQNFGMLAYIGNNRALADLPQAKFGGYSTWIFWRSAYITKLVSLKNKVQVLLNWMKASVHGRDISRL